MGKSRKFKLCDSHCHLHLMGGEVEKYMDMLIVGVSEDLDSSKETLSISEEYDNVIPFVGVHPWRVRGVRGDWIRELEKLVDRGAKGIGEIGLDRVYQLETYEKQKPIFRAQVRLAREYGLPVNLHAIGAWREVFETLLKEDVEKAVIHWYIGPLELLKDIREANYYVSVNPIVELEERHRRVVEEADIEILLTESDAPYEYKGLKLKPEGTVKCVEAIAKLKNLPEDVVAEKVYNNLRKYLRSL